MKIIKKRITTTVVRTEVYLPISEVRETRCRPDFIRSTLSESGMVLDEPIQKPIQQLLYREEEEEEGSGGYLFYQDIPESHEEKLLFDMTFPLCQKEETA